MRTLVLLLLFSVFVGCTSHNPKKLDFVQTNTLELHDSSSNRDIDVETYFVDTSRHEGLVILNAGYGCSNTEYSYITKLFAQEGYLVAAIHHEAEHDPPLPIGDSIYDKRLPFWQQGVSTIQFVKSYFQLKQHSFQKAILVGHSNGGDIAALYATLYSNEVQALITLDHRRVPLPLNRDFKTLSFRGYDFPADDGVIPNPDQCEEYNISLYSLDSVGHNFMRDNGSRKMKREVIAEISKLLEFQ